MPSITQLLAIALSTTCVNAIAAQPTYPPSSSAPPSHQSLYKVELETVPCCIDMGKDTALSFKVVDPTGKPVTRFQPVHDRPMHLIAVSRDLSFFAHDHPQQQPDGAFTLKRSFPEAGEHLLFAEFRPESGDDQIVRLPVTVKKGPAKPAGTLRPDATKPKTIDGYSVHLVAPDSLSAGLPTTLTFRISSAGNEVSHLEPYMGAAGHLMVVDAEATTLLHYHSGRSPSDGGHDGHHVAHSDSGSGRSGEVPFDVEFPSPGLYKVWGQFQHRGKVITAPFVVMVAPRSR